MVDINMNLLRFKKISGTGIENKNILNRQLAEKVYKPIIRKFNKIKLHSPFIDNIWGADLEIGNW